MPKGFGGMPGGMPNMNNLLKQAQKMQKQMEEMQAELETKTIEVTSGGGAVKIVITGKRHIQSLELSPGIVDPDDVEMLQDLITAALNEAIRQVDELTEKNMGSLTGGMNMPGMF